MAGSSSRSTGVTVTTTPRLRRGQLGDDPARSRQRARQLVRRADRRELEGIAETPRRRPGPRPAHPSRRRPVTTRTPPVAIASAPALRSSLMSSSTPGPSIGPRIEIDDAGTADRVEPGVRPDALEVGGDLVDRHVAARLVRGQRRELDLERRRPRGAAGRCGRSGWRRGPSGPATTAGRGPSSPACERSWMTTSRPRMSGDGRDRDLAARAVHGQPPRLGRGRRRRCRRLGCGRE